MTFANTFGQPEYKTKLKQNKNKIIFRIFETTFKSWELEKN